MLIVLEVELVVVGELGGSGESPKAQSSALPPPAPLPGPPSLPGPPQHPLGPSLTSSPLGMRRLEMMMILSSLSKVTTSATQFGAHEWLMYLGDEGGQHQPGGRTDGRHGSLQGRPTTPKPPALTWPGPPSAWRQ